MKTKSLLHALGRASADFIVPSVPLVHLLRLSNTEQKTGNLPEPSP